MNRRLALLSLSVTLGFMLLLAVGGLAIYAAPAAGPLPKASQAAPLPAQPAVPTPLACVNFEDPTLGTAYHVGDSFTDSGVKIDLRPFVWADGTNYTSGEAVISNGGQAGGSGQEVTVKNISLSFDFGASLTGLSFLFGEYGGNLNIEINGDFRNFANFHDIDGAVIGGVNVAVLHGMGNDKGSVHLMGMVNSFAVGGQELYIDRVCPARVEPRADLGDAPASANHFSVTMQAYPSVPAKFPTVFFQNIGPVGPRHLRPDLFHLGERVSYEIEADLGYDQDPTNNIIPPTGIPNLDEFDDGLKLDGINLPDCRESAFDVQVYIDPAIVGTVDRGFINIWFDGNRNGTWDKNQCTDAAGNTRDVPEHVVIDAPVDIPALGAGLHTLNVSTTVPIFNPEPNQPAWLRVTLSELPSPKTDVITSTAGVLHYGDGRGTKTSVTPVGQQEIAGFWLGETEDYLIPGAGYPAELVIRKTADVTHTVLGGEIVFTVTVANLSNVTATAVVVEDPIPAGTEYISGSVGANFGAATYDAAANKIFWHDNIPAGSTLVIHFAVKVKPVNDLECRSIGNIARLAMGNLLLSSNPVEVPVLCPDLGDAPDSTNHPGAGMTAYGTAIARFPTVYDPATGAPPGPAHWLPRRDAWLGTGVSRERDADLMPDEDGQPNLRPAADVPDLDKHDDGVRWPDKLRHCELTTVTAVVNVVGPKRERYLNAWLDWNRDGDWEDTFACTDAAGNSIPAPEWAVQDRVVTFGPGLHTVVITDVLVFNPEPQRSIWARFTLSDEPAPKNPANSRADGRGPDAGYRFGETEDYLIPGVQQPPDVQITKSANVTQTHIGGVIEFQITVHNQGNTPASGVVVEDEIPAGTQYVAGSLGATSGSAIYDAGQNRILWTGNIPAGATVLIRFKVKVVGVSHSDCHFTVRNEAHMAVAGTITASNVVEIPVICQPPPDIGIAKLTPVTVTVPGGVIDYTILVSNTGGSTAEGVVVEDRLPAGTQYVSGTLGATFGTAVYDPARHQIRWHGDLAPGSMLEIKFSVKVAVAELGCDRVIKNRAYLILSNGTALASAEVETHVICPDVGDAPDSSNHFGSGMTAYGVVTATFPTVYDPATGAPPGPAHWRPRKDAWLGRWVSRERDADLMPDEDGHPNLRPPSNDANLDEFDDGVRLPIVLRHCEPTQIPVIVTVVGPQRERYLNVWFDWNRDGDWGDKFDCPGAVTGEWAVRDYVVNLGPGVHTVLLPAFLPFNPEPRLPMWARFTLSDEPAPKNPATQLADGRGPDKGYRFGETEDYLLPGQHGEPELKIRKTVDKVHASPGDELQYTIIMHNAGNALAAGVHMEDAIPVGTAYISGTLWASKPVTNYVPGLVTWDGDIVPAETVTVTFKVRIGVASVVARCDGNIRNVAKVVTPEGVTQASEEVYTYLLCPDLGDAPDSTNHHGVGMTTYPTVVTATFPTVFDSATGAPPGPIHWQPTQDSWLGPRRLPPSGEKDADLMPDQDGRTNIWPPDNKADRDERDNGLIRDNLDLPHCRLTTLTYRVTIVGPQRERFVNVWFDWNRDGDWADVLDCPGALASEWAVRNQVLTFGPGEYVVTTPAFLPWHPDPGNRHQPLWMRITLSERPVPPVSTIPSGADGSGPVGGYKYGETEDYYLGLEPQPVAPDVWVTKQVRRVNFGPQVTPGGPHDVPHFYFLIEYGNSGGSPAADVVVTDTLPMSLTYRASYSVPNVEPPTVTTSTVAWNVGTLYPGSMGSIALVVEGLEQIPPGTLLTNTVTITTSTAGDDPSNNTDVVTGTLPLLPPRILWPIPGTTCTGTLTVTGKSQVGTFVDLYVDGVYTATTTVDAQGNWDVPLTLSDGTHGIYAKARLVDGTESLPSPTVVVVVDSSLVWDPMSMTFTTVWPGGWTWVQHIRDEDGRADPDGWKVALRTGITTTQQYTVSVRICCQNPTGVTLTVGSDVYTMADTGGGWYQTVIDAPGVPNAPITLTVNCDGITGGGEGEGLIDPDGYIFDVDVGKSTTNLSGLTVTCLEYDQSTSGWDRWPAELYEEQVNPQTTGDDGYYSFFTPPGDYQITVDETTDYQGYRSWTLTVISTPVHLDIPLTKVYTEAQYAVSVDASGFVPATLEVVQGSVVEWTNNEVLDGVWHTTTSDVDARTDTRGWDSGLLDSGDSYRRRFDTLGTFTYYDHENPSLKGTIKVCYPYDLNCDNTVDVTDIVGVAQLWGAASGAGNGYDARYDVDGNNVIDIVDILHVANQWQWTAP